jgi:ribose/xylose/arabinose/galactoside ABC-type transport system permease subunit
MSNSEQINLERSKKTSSFVRLFESLGIYLGIVILILIGLWKDGDFLTPNNLLQMLKAEAQFLAIAITGAYLITYGGKMADLSIPAIMTASGFVTIYFLEPLGFYPAVFIGLGAGTLIGLINGLAVGVLNLNPIIWTLAMNFIADGVLRWAFSGNQIYPQNQMFLAINEKHYPLIILVVLIILFTILIKYTRIGHSVLMVGASEKVAKSSGVKNAKTITLMFLLSSVCSAIAGICYCSSAKLATFETGNGYDFKVVTAIVLGGISLQGGRGYFFGAIGGLIFITLLEVDMILFKINLYDQEIIKGLMFIAVVGLGVHLSRKAGRHV